MTEQLPPSNLRRCRFRSDRHSPQTTARYDRVCLVSIKIDTAQVLIQLRVFDLSVKLVSPSVACSMTFFCAQPKAGLCFFGRFVSLDRIGDIQYRCRRPGEDSFSLDRDIPNEIRRLHSGLHIPDTDNSSIRLRSRPKHELVSSSQTFV